MQTRLPRIFWIGDSIAVHYRPWLLRNLEGVAEIETRGGYSEALKDLDHPRGSNCGDSTMALAFLKVLVEREDFASFNWVVFNCGLHDIRRDPATDAIQVPLQEYRETLSGILELVRKHGKRPVWITTTAVDDERHLRCYPGGEIIRRNCDVLAYNAAALEIMTEAKVPVIDLNRFTAGLDGELYNDHVHYFDEVRQQQAAFVSGHVERLLIEAAQ